MRARRTDAKHKAVLDAIRALGYPCMSLHAHGKGLEDILVAVRCLDEVALEVHKSWLLVEVKTIERESTGYYRHTPAQEEWYEKTEGFPRLIVFGADDAQAKMKARYG